MFPSSSSRNPFPYTDHTIVGRSFTDHENPNSKHEGPPSSFLHFPSPFFDDDDLLVDHLLSQQFLIATTAQAGSDINEAASTKAANINNEMTSNVAAEWTHKEVVSKKRSNGAKKQTPRKRTGKKDRHSKIYTAQGLRDRRMRLSLQIARKFFDLQDMLGFDKASKTIEWLFTKSKAAIKELTGNLPQVRHSGSSGGKNVSSTSTEYKLRSEIKETGNNGDQKGVVVKGESFVGVSREKKNRKSRNPAFDLLARESREKARARARERTREKMMIRSLEKSQKCSETNPNNLERIGSSSPFETGEVSGSRSQEMNSSLEVVAEVEEPSTHSLEHQMATIGVIEKILGMTSTLRSPSSIFNYSCNVAVSSGIISNGDFQGFPGQWDMDKARIHSNYCAMTNIDPSTGNVQEPNSSSSFMTTSNIGLQSQFLENQLSCCPLDDNNNQRLY